MNYIVEKEWLAARLHDPNIRIVDCRFTLGKPEEGKSLYTSEHIPGSIYFHLEKDLSGPVREHGGRHPLPDLDAFRNLLETAGINKETIIVAYDDGAGAFAARLWWMMAYAGHQSVYVLNGGFRSWKQAGYPVNGEIPVYDRTEYKVNVNSDILATYQEVKKAVSGENPHAVLIDSREEKRYLGIEEPIDKKAGHIPGAVNKNWSESLENGFFLPENKQEARFSEFSKNRELIVYCGSGVTAAPNYLALKEAGFKNVKLYAGSFSDWISHPENKVNIGRE